jgi:hypothetical protein
LGGRGTEVVHVDEDALVEEFGNSTLRNLGYVAGRKSKCE